MIAAFLASWPLFHNAYLSGWLIAVLLSLVGVMVVARDQIFLGAAVSQASMLGITAGMWVGAWSTAAWVSGDAFLSAAGGLFAIAAALLTGEIRFFRESREAVTGWVFLVGSSASILIVAHSAHGLEEVHRLLASTIIGASAGDVLAFVFLTGLAAAALVGWRPTLLLLAMDAEMARAAGVRVGAWDTAISMALGLCVALAIRVSGMTYTFGCLVLPALIAKNVCREMGSMFVVAPVTGLAAAVIGFVLAHGYDYPPGQVTVAVLCGALVVAWAWRARR